MTEEPFLCVGEIDKKKIWIRQPEHQYPPPLTWLSNSEQPQLPWKTPWIVLCKEASGEQSISEPAALERATRQCWWL